MRTCAPNKGVVSCNYRYVVHTASLVGQIWVGAFWEPWLCAKCGVGERWNAPPPKSCGPPWPSKKHLKGVVYHLCELLCITTRTYIMVARQNAMVLLPQYNKCTHTDPFDVFFGGPWWPTCFGGGAFQRSPTPHFAHNHGSQNAPTHI